MTTLTDKYINPFTDFGFKKLFGEEANKDLLIDFLNTLLEGEQPTILGFYGDSMDVLNGFYPTEAQMGELQHELDDRPIHLLNLLKFRDKAEYSDGRETELSGREAYGLYGQPMLEVLKKYGAEVTYSSEVTGLIIGMVEELWDYMVIVKYPSRRVLLEMTSSDVFKALSIHREAGLKGQLNIETRLPYVQT